MERKRSFTNGPSTGAEVTDNINSPEHYKLPDIECIDAMRAVFGDEAVETYCRLNAFKYIWRSPRKPTQDDFENEKKAIWYLRFSTGDDPRA